MGKKRLNPDCGEDVLQAIRDAYPEGVVNDDILSTQDSYYHAIRDEVRRALRAIKGAVPLYERPPEGSLHWNAGSEVNMDPPDWEEKPATYDLLFLGLEGDQFTFEGEMEDDQSLEAATHAKSRSVPSEGRIGCAVGVCTLAPFAAVRFTEVEWTKSGSQTAPDIHPAVYNLDGSELDVEAHYEEIYLEEGILALRALREEISGILHGFGIRVLTGNELKYTIPKLQLDAERTRHYDERHFFIQSLSGNSGISKTEVTVEDAFFFQGL
jgi:hypothetical protein